MGREIRRVPLNWHHPKDKHGSFIPMHDRTFKEVADAWLIENTAWQDGTHKDLINEPERKTKYPYFWLWNGAPPEENCYRPEWTEANPATGWQVYETVTEGTPVTPVFESKKKLRDWLVLAGYKPEDADAFVEAEWAPSGIFTSSKMLSWNIEGYGAATGRTKKRK